MSFVKIHLQETKITNNVVIHFIDHYSELITSLIIDTQKWEICFPLIVFLTKLGLLDTHCYIITVHKCAYLHFYGYNDGIEVGSQGLM